MKGHIAVLAAGVLTAGCWSPTEGLEKAMDNAVTGGAARAVIEKANAGRRAIVEVFVDSETGYQKIRGRLIGGDECTEPMQPTRPGTTVERGWAQGA